MSVEMKEQKLLNIKTSMRGEIEVDLSDVNKKYKEAEFRVKKAIRHFTLTIKENRTTIVAMSTGGSTNLTTADTLDLAIDKMLAKIVLEG